MPPKAKRARIGESAVVFSGLFAASSGDAQKQGEIQRQLTQALAGSDRAYGDAIGAGDCFFDALAQSLNEARETKDYTVESLRKLCSDYTLDLEKQHPVDAGNATEETRSANWIFQALGKNAILYGEYLAQSGWSAADAKLMQDQFRIGNGLAVWGEQHVDARILCERLGVELHVLEIHEEHFDQAEIPLILHQVVDSRDVRQIDEHPVAAYQKANVLHLMVWRNHFVPILKQATLLKAAEKEDEEDDSGIPDDWQQWAISVLGEATLPHLGLPVRWDDTQGKHTKIAFDPATRRTIEVDSGKVVEHKVPPIGFITSTRGVNVMPGTDRPASARYARYLDLLLNRDAIIEDAHGHKLAPCFLHGEYVQVAALQADHAQAKSEIERRQRALVEKLNMEPAFAEFLLKQEGMDKFFVQVDGVYYGTLFFYELYFNDIDNIWLICDACNLHKKDQETVEWLDKQWLYGQEFKDYLGEVNDRAILAKTQTKQGLAEVAIEWFWKRHANYILTQKKMLEEVVKPIQILNIQVDRVVGRGQKRRAERKQASLDFRVRLLSEIAQASGLGMPRRPSESPHSSSNGNDYLDLRDAEGRQLFPTREQYNLSVEKAVGIVVGMTRDVVAVQLVDDMEKSARRDDAQIPTSHERNDEPRQEI